MNIFNEMKVIMMMTQGKLRKAVYIQCELFKEMYTYLHNCLYCGVVMEIFYSQFLENVM